MSEQIASANQSTRVAIVLVAVIAWFFGGVQISITNLALRSAAVGLLGNTGWIEQPRYDDLTARSRTESLSPSEQRQLDGWNALVTKWYAWYQCAFLFGAAAGGFLFGRLGDRLGRTRALALSVGVFSVFTGLSYWVAGPSELLFLRFLACLGIGGTWPNGVALVTEAFSRIAGPLMASLIGMAGNVGIFAMSTLATQQEVTPESWRWVMWVGASPILLAVIVWVWIPESSSWLAQKSATDGGKAPGGTALEVFRSPFGRLTLVGIALATVPLIGGWGSANWMMPWADEAGAMAENPDPFLKARVGQARSLTSIVGSFMAGWIALRMGRRTLYFVTSLGALIAAQYAFWFTTPTDSDFLIWVACLGFFNGIYFGWLPFFLPELFPTRVRATGAGVSFNFGRILTALTIFFTGTLIGWFNGDYARIGQVTSLVFALGMICILFAPDPTRQEPDGETV